MATLHLMVGLPCSGKTTLAKKLEQERSALRLTPDEWQIALFGQDAEEPEHDARHSLIEAMLWKIASRSSGLAGWRVPGCNGGAIGSGMSASTLYQCVGISLCGKTKCVVGEELTVQAPG